MFSEALNLYREKLIFSFLKLLENPTEKLTDPLHLWVVNLSYLKY